MKLYELFGRLYTSSGARTDQRGRDTPDTGGSTLADTSSPHRLADTTPDPTCNPVLSLDASQLMRGRDAVAEMQQKASQRIQRLHTDRRSLVSRYAELRAEGRTAEKEALVRLFKGLDLQIEKQEIYHNDLLNWRQLLDNLLMTHEFAALRERVKTDALAGMNFAALREVWDRASAWELDQRNKVTELNQDVQRNDSDATLQAQAEYADAERMLDQLSEDDYQRLVNANMAPVEDLADQVERQLSGLGMAITAKSPDPTFIRGRS